VRRAGEEAVEAVEECESKPLFVLFKCESFVLCRPYSH
jgi:hypothetical protein